MRNQDEAWEFGVRLAKIGFAILLGEVPNRGPCLTAGA